MDDDRKNEKIKKMEKFEDIKEFIFNLRNNGSSLSVDRMKKFVSLLGNPQENFMSLHVAGTNGKGSVCAFLDSALRANGLNAGLFTSPHLINLGERVKVNGKELSEEEIISYVAKLKELAKDLEGTENYPTFFEIITSVAFCHFSNQKIDVAVVEVGLGGRLDATNILTPKISVITSIGKDHTQYLGDTHSKIAYEKAGIIKKSVPVVCGYLDKESKEVIAKVAKEKDAPLYDVRDFFNENELPKTSLFGNYQKKNAAIALLALRILNEQKVLITDEKKSLEAFKNTRWSARWEAFTLKNNAQLILDSSHNEEGAKVLEENLKTLKEKPVIAVGVLGEERAVPLLKVVAKYAKKIIFLTPNQPRALSFDELKICLEKISSEQESEKIKNPEIEKIPPYEFSTIENLFSEKMYCSKVNANETIICTGSIYLAGEILSTLKGLSKPSLSDLL